MQTRQNYQPSKSKSQFDWSLVERSLARMGRTIADVPVRLDAKGAEKWLSRLVFPVSYRTLERCPITWQRVNGRRVAETEELFSVAFSKLNAAPKIRSGRQPAQQEAA